MGGMEARVQGTELTSLRGVEGHPAGRPQSPPIKGLNLQPVGAVGPQASQDGASGIGWHHYMAFVDVPLAVPPLTAFPPVRHLQVDRRPQKDRKGLAVTQVGVGWGEKHVFLMALPREQLAETQPQSCHSWSPHPSPRGFLQPPHDGLLHCIPGGGP